MYKVFINEDIENKAKCGVPLFFKNISSDKILLINEKDEAIAVYKRDSGDKFICQRGLF